MLRLALPRPGLPFLRRASVAALGLAACAAVGALPAFDDVRTAHHPSDVRIVDRQGALQAAAQTA